MERDTLMPYCFICGKPLHVEKYNNFENYRSSYVTSCHGEVKVFIINDKDLIELDYDGVHGLFDSMIDHLSFKEEEV